MEHAARRYQGKYHDSSVRRLTYHYHEHDCHAGNHALKNSYVVEGKKDYGVSMGTCTSSKPFGQIRG